MTDEFEPNELAQQASGDASSKNISRKHEPMRFWATVSLDGGHIRDVEAAEGREMAETLLLSSYSPKLRLLYEVKPVTVTVDDNLTSPPQE